MRAALIPNASPERQAMHRFYVPAALIREGCAQLSSEQQKQIKLVLRMKPGDTVLVFDGSGLEFRSELRSDGAGGVCARLVEGYRPDTEPPFRLTIVQGIPKGDRLEMILQKCTELGAAEFLIVQTERSVPRITGDKIGPKLERWRAIVKEAAEQSGRACLPAVDGVMTLRDALGRVKKRGPVLIAWEQQRGAELCTMLRRLKGESDIAMMIGPEGGYAPDEVNAAVEAGAVPVSLGTRILRTETAAIAASAILIHGLEQSSAC